MLVYTLPPEPSRYWADVWRRPGAAGAAYPQKGVAALPDDPTGDARRGARAPVGRGNGAPFPGLFGGRPGEREEAFGGTRDAGYREVSGRRRNFQAESEEKVEDLVRQEAWVGKLRTRDRFGVPLSGEVGQEPSACREGSEAFAASVYGAGDHGSADTS